jgi:hypothetical protein
VPARPCSSSYRPPWRIGRRRRGSKARPAKLEKARVRGPRRIDTSRYPSLGAVNRTAKNPFAKPFAILENARLSVRSNIMDMADVSGIEIVRYVQEGRRRSRPRPKTFQRPCFPTPHTSHTVGTSQPAVGRRPGRSQPWEGGQQVTTWPRISQFDECWEVEKVRRESSTAQASGGLFFLSD